ncbi:hypothetical protein DPMN_045363 [Dreissena polymorpha]|uniref:Uncharacterized protein n=1 Tax=Dreissena polymorpha TaxID=45954 RepID=A0A9D4D4R5_DREPO|nr:hypothetical protein DPMN_045363 [Dreissena polymorpha]
MSSMSPKSPPIRIEDKASSISKFNQTQSSIVKEHTGNVAFCDRCFQIPCSSYKTHCEHVKVFEIGT